MCLLLADIQINHRNDENDAEQDERRRRCATLVMSGDGVVNEADHRVKSSGRTGRTHIVTEDTDNARIFLEAADKAGNYDVGKHGRKERNGNLRKDAYARRAVDLRRIVILLVDALQTAEKDQNLKGQSVPDDIHHLNRDVRPIRRA